MPLASPRVPNGLAFSCRERAGTNCQKATDRARDAVSCTAMFGVPSRHSGWYQHPPTTLACSHAGTTGVWSGSRTSGTTPGTTDFYLNQAPLVARFTERAFRTTGARTTPAQRASRTTGLRTTPAPRAPARRSRYNARLGSATRSTNLKKRNGDHAATGAERFGIQLPRARRVAPSKTERSRARRGQLQCRVRRSGRPPSGCLPQLPTTPTWYHTGTTGVTLSHAHLGSRAAQRASI